MAKSQRKRGAVLGGCIGGDPSRWWIREPLTYIMAPLALKYQNSMGWGEIFVWGRVSILGFLYVVHWVIYATPIHPGFPPFAVWEVGPVLGGFINPK